MQFRAVLGITLFVTIGAVEFGRAQDLVPLAEPADVAGAPETFEAFCRLCHVSETLSRSWYGDAVGEEAARREEELVARLRHHSASPYRSHEEIAAWLRQLSEKP